MERIRIFRLLVSLRRRLIVEMVEIRASDSTTSYKQIKLYARTNIAA